MSYKSKELFVSFAYEIGRNGEKKFGHGNAIVQQNDYCRITGESIKEMEQGIIKMNGWTDLDPHVCITNWRRFEE